MRTILPTTCLLIMAVLTSARTGLTSQNFEKEIELPELVSRSQIIVRAKYDGEEEAAGHFFVQKVLRGTLPSLPEPEIAANGNKPRAPRPPRLNVYPANSSEQASDEKELRETGISRGHIHPAFRPKAPLKLKPGSVYLVFLNPSQDGARTIYELSAINAYLSAKVSDEQGVESLLLAPGPRLSPPPAAQASRQPGS